MKMCTNCYELFETNLTQCPLWGCIGELVDIDEQICAEISAINRIFKKLNVPLKTNYYCSSHVNRNVFDPTFIDRHYYTSYQPYVMFVLPPHESGKEHAEIFRKITRSLNSVITDKRRYEHPEICLTVERNKYTEIDKGLSYFRIIIRSQVCKSTDKPGKDISYEELEENRLVASQLFITFLRTVIKRAEEFIIDHDENKK